MLDYIHCSLCGKVVAPAEALLVRDSVGGFEELCKKCYEEHENPGIRSVIKGKVLWFLMTPPVRTVCGGLQSIFG